MIRKLAIALGLAVAVTGFWVRPADAIIGPCNNCADYGPIVYVSDGTTLNASVQVADTPWDTTGLSYVVHVPTDATVTSYQFTGSMQVPRSLTVVTDEPDGSYAVDTLVSDPTNVAVYTGLVAKNTAIGCGTDQESGAANTAITTTAAITGSC